MTGLVGTSISIVLFVIAIMLAVYDVECRDHSDDDDEVIICFPIITAFMLVISGILTLSFGIVFIIGACDAANIANNPRPIVQLGHWPGWELIS